MKIRKVHTKIWKDSWFNALSRSSAFLFMYLITNDHMGFSGYVEIPDRVICFETGLTTTELQKAKEELSPKVTFFKDWVLVKNIQKHDPVKGTNNTLQIAFEKEISLIPPEVKENLDGTSIPHRSPIDGTYETPNGLYIYGNGNGKEESVRETKNSLTDNLDDESVLAVAKKYKISPEKVQLYKEKYVLWVKGNPKDKKTKGRDMKSTVMSWILGDISEGKLKPQKSFEDKIREEVPDARII